MIFGARKQEILLFIRECVFGGTINAQFQSLFGQNLYVGLYMIRGLKTIHILGDQKYRCIEVLPQIIDLMITKDLNW